MCRKPDFVAASDFKNVSNLSHLKFLLLSDDFGKSFYKIPTSDFAAVSINNTVHVCTFSQFIQDYLFFEVLNISQTLELTLLSFMKKPSTLPRDFSFQILPKIDRNMLLVQPVSQIETFTEFDQYEHGEREGTTTYNLYFFNNLFGLVADHDDVFEPSISVVQEELTTTQQSSHSSPVVATRKRPAPEYSNIHNRQCLNCFCTSTPLWRRGPDGTASLCNACGVKFKSGKLVMSPELVEANLKIIKSESN